MRARIRAIIVQEIRRQSERRQQPARRIRAIFRDRRAIDLLVKSEDASSPLSDKEIVEILEKRGIPIARRTVAKYRTELNILPSNMRRRY